MSIYWKTKRIGNEIRGRRVFVRKGCAVAVPVDASSLCRCAGYSVVNQDEWVLSGIIKVRKIGYNVVI